MSDHDRKRSHKAHGRMQVPTMEPRALTVPYYNDREPVVPIPVEYDLVAIGATDREREAVQAAANAVREYERVLERNMKAGDRSGGANTLTMSESAEVILDRMLEGEKWQRRAKLLSLARKMATEQGASKCYVKAGNWRKNLERVG